MDVATSVSLSLLVIALVYGTVFWVGTHAHHGEDTE